MKVDIPYGKLSVSAVVLAGMLENTKFAFDLLSSLEDLITSDGGRAGKDLDPLTFQVTVDALTDQCRHYLHSVEGEAAKMLMELPNGAEIVEGTEPPWRAISEARRDLQDGRPT